MILLIDKKCIHCKSVENLDKKYRNIHKWYVADGFADIDGEKIKLAPQISVLPCLIDGLNYYLTVAPILEHLEKSGEINAKSDIL